MHAGLRLNKLTMSYLIQFIKIRFNLLSARVLILIQYFWDTKLLLFPSATIRILENFFSRFHISISISVGKCTLRIYIYRVRAPK